MNETVTYDYTELLTMTYNELVNLNGNIEAIEYICTFGMAIISGSIVGVCISYFIGKLLRTR